MESEGRRVRLEGRGKMKRSGWEKKHGERGKWEEEGKGLEIV